MPDAFHRVLAPAIDDKRAQETTMSRDRPAEPITIRAAKEIVSGIDALAAAMDRSRNDVVNQALRQDLETKCLADRAHRGGPRRRP
jgi:Ribbon-helix-helix protein, copG family